MRTLEGITVISLEQAIAAPLCTRHLADLGARVVKIERPLSGDFGRAYDQRARGLSSHFVWTSRAKQSLTLDIKAPQASPILHGLLASADVMVQNLAPGATTRLGLDWDTLHARYPQLVLCDISGYGPDGPYRDKKAYDLLIQAEAGVVSVTGTQEAPAKAGISVADIAAGMYAYSSILAALLRRGRTGEGSHVEISMLEAMVEWSSYPLYYTLDGAPPPPRTGASHATIQPYGPFQAGDGKSVVLGVQNEREWQAFCTQVLEQPALAGDPRFARNTDRVAHRDVLHALVEAAFAPLTAEAVVARLDAAGIANARMNTLQEVWAHPQLQARGRWTQVDTPAGAMPALLPPGLSAEDDPHMAPVPALGEHTDEILDALGYAATDIAALRVSGVV